MEVPEEIQPKAVRKSRKKVVEELPEEVPEEVPEELPEEVLEQPKKARAPAGASRAQGKACASPRAAAGPGRLRTQRLMEKERRVERLANMRFA